MYVVCTVHYKIYHNTNVPNRAVLEISTSTGYLFYLIAAKILWTLSRIKIICAERYLNYASQDIIHFWIGWKMAEQQLSEFEFIFYHFENFANFSMRNFITFQDIHKYNSFQYTGKNYTYRYFENGCREKKMVSFVISDPEWSYASVLV